MSILTIIMAICFFYRSKKLKETKDINYVWGYPKKIRDTEGYAKLYAKLYFFTGIMFIILELFSLLNKYYFDFSISVVFVGLCIIFILSIIGSRIIEKKSKKFKY